MIIHIGTVVQTTFALLDNEGNVVKKLPYNLEIPQINEGSFVEAHKFLANAKVELAQKLREEQEAATKGSVEEPTE